MIYIDLHHIEAIKNHGVKTYPEECCGLLLGKAVAQGKLVQQVWETVNSWEPESFEDLATPGASKLNRFSIAPETLLAAHKKAREVELDIVGIYHSHPNHPAIPSEFDRAVAHPGYSYLIISVHQGQPQSMLSWELDPQRQFQSEEIITI
ncbi:M67 family metallopeptidase [Gloeocapsa sp. PCC 73106]|uniref:M67 family metallopeptidase n=1 Tax=Gloeocapsa sp. PCC 73106 TaxID=102232 RepID=UPI0002AC1422|nr:M67 family metallopeptidase [Gloeocapsa sp. PCC 73106]ELR97214.1 putative metal-dependent protease of the PAD1/JAB1 superfamily [Gloeocapsa sp. PCC 73106]